MILMDNAVADIIFEPHNVALHCFHLFSNLLRRSRFKISGAQFESEIKNGLRNVGISAVWKSHSVSQLVGKICRLNRLVSAGEFHFRLPFLESPSVIRLLTNSVMDTLYPVAASKST
jgi:hypothetical protein